MNDELYHFKYIDRIKTASGKFRYVYSFDNKKYSNKLNNSSSKFEPHKKDDNFNNVNKNKLDNSSFKFKPHKKKETKGNAANIFISKFLNKALKYFR